ncbi:MAG: sulfur carrier protein ThiS [Candidatus Omnitrophica bacterium]|nr:sulfur carrier protein ThiS [Candidatus Omnitrophota bacterium]
MQIHINGELQLIEGQKTLHELLSELHIKKEAVVCELNRTVVDKNLYHQVRLRDQDSLEIVHFVGGG